MAERKAKAPPRYELTCGCGTTVALRSLFKSVRCECCKAYLIYARNERQDLVLSCAGTLVIRADLAHPAKRPAKRAGKKGVRR